MSVRRFKGLTCLAASATSFKCFESILATFIAHVRACGVCLLQGAQKDKLEYYMSLGCALFQSVRALRDARQPHSLSPDDGLSARTDLPTIAALQLLG